MREGGGSRLKGNKGGKGGKDDRLGSRERAKVRPLRGVKSIWCIQSSFVRE